MGAPHLAASRFPPVESVIPHRAPFLFIDAVTALRESFIASRRLFRADEPFFPGHFPGRPVVPSLLLVEGLAQTMAYYAHFRQPLRHILLVGVDGARFRAVVEAGSEVTFEVEFGEERFGLLTGHGQARAGNRVVAEATLKGFSGTGGPFHGGGESRRAD
jgi:3-hydroxyacyl-[acyl-carrier-protein] dehydratase